MVCIYLCVHAQRSVWCVSCLHIFLEKNSSVFGFKFKAKLNFIAVDLYSQLLKEPGEHAAFLILAAFSMYIARKTFF